MSGELPAGPRVAPSILSSDFARLGAQVEEVMAAGARVIHVDVMDGHFVPPITIGPLIVDEVMAARARVIHVDVMDGHFVPPITIGPLIVDALREQVHGAGGWLDVHLMVERPETRVDDFARAGADSISVHAEATPHLHYALQAVRAAGCLAGLALNPATAPEAVWGAAASADIVLCMTVNPGWGGQPWIEGSEHKVKALAAALPDGVRVEVDGGVDATTGALAAGAGASLFVAGSSIFGAADPAAAYREIAAAVGDAGG